MGVQIFHQLKYSGYGIGRVEIIVHGLVKFFHKLLGSLIVSQLTLGHSPFRGRADEVLQILRCRHNPIQAVLGGLHQLGAEV